MSKEEILKYAMKVAGGNMNLHLFFELWVWQFAASLLVFALLWSALGLFLGARYLLRRRKKKLSPPDYSAWVSAHIEAISRASDIPIELLDREFKEGK